MYCKPLDLMDNPTTTGHKKNSPAQHGQCYPCRHCKLGSKTNAKSGQKEGSSTFLSFASTLNGIKPKSGNVLVLKSVLSWLPAWKPRL